MRFEAPANLLWLLPAAASILAIYILKLRRRDVVVPSTLLWSRVIRDVQANAPFQRLRRNALLLVQLLAALLLGCTLAAPCVRSAAAGGRRIVIVVGTSASMAATDVRPDRLSVARRIAHNIVDRRGPGDRIALLSAAAQPELVSGFTSDGYALGQAIDSLHVHQTPCRLRESLRLAADLAAAAKSGPGGRIEVISDGTGDDPAGGSLDLGALTVGYHPVGVRQDNAAIVAADYRRQPGADHALELLVVAHNYSNKPRRCDEEIYAGKELVEAHEIALAPNGETTEPYDLPEPGSPLKLRIHLDVNDDLVVDNDSYVVLRPRKAIRVLLVTAGDRFLEQALQADPDVELSEAAVFPGSAGFDVVVFDGAAPAHLPAAGHYLFLHCTSDRAPVHVTGIASAAEAVDWDRENPVLSFVDLTGDRFGSVLRAEPLDWGKEIAVADTGSLVVVGEHGPTRAEFAAFAVTDSVFPLKVAFPIFISNSVRWLASTEGSRDSVSVRTGEPVVIPASPGTTVDVTRPDGGRVALTAGGDGAADLAATDEIGFYTVRSPRTTWEFAANLSDPAESDTMPHPALAVSSSPIRSGAHLVVATRSLAPPFALAVLVLLGLEWWMYHRRAYLG